MIVVNLFGGPGCGKTGTSHGVMHYLKKNHYRCEYVPEYVKDIVYDDTSDEVAVNQGFSSGRLADQRHIFSEQHRRLYRLQNKVDIVITDGPLFNSIVYSGKSGANRLFHDDVFHEFCKHDNLNIYLPRQTVYRKEGRYQDEAGAIEIDEEIIRCFNYFGVKYSTVNLETAVDEIVALINAKMTVCERCGSFTGDCKVC